MRTDLIKIYTDIYKLNYWSSKESVSGGGSEIGSTNKIREILPVLFKNYGVKTFIDAPCGDFNWMKLVDMSLLDSYIGIDIVKEVIFTNQCKYTTDKINFQVGDLTSTKLPAGDMILVKDCFIHFSFEDIFSAIENIKYSGIKYLAINHSNDIDKNDSIMTGGGHRPINFSIKPFCFKNVGEYEIDYSSLVVYKVNDL